MKAIDQQETYFFTNLKFILGLVGILYHSWRLQSPQFYNSGPDLAGPFWLIEYFMWVLHNFRIQIFFIISGYLLAHNLNTKGDTFYFRKVIGRIIWICILMYFVFVPLVLTMQACLRRAELSLSMDFLSSYYLELMSSATLSHRWSYGWFVYFLLLCTFIGGCLVIGLKRVSFLSAVFPNLQIRSRFFGLGVFITFFCICSNFSAWFDLGKPFNSNLTSVEVIPFVYYFMYFAIGMVFAQSSAIMALVLRRTSVYGLFSFISFVTVYLAVTNTLYQSYPVVFAVFKTFGTVLMPMWLLALSKKYINRPMPRIQPFGHTKVFLAIYILHIPIIYAILILMRPFELHRLTQFFLTSIATTIFVFSLLKLFRLDRQSF